MCGRSILFMFGQHYVRRKGRQAQRHEASILCVAPHTSFFDVIAFFALDGNPSGVSRIENLDVPLLGSMLIIDAFLSRTKQRTASILFPFDVTSTYHLTNPCNNTFSYMKSKRWLLISDSR